MRALILGIGGQDGSYLANFLLKKGYEVIGSSRDAEISEFINLKKLGIYDKVKKKFQFQLMTMKVFLML